jgi:hypothetical protein
MDTPHLTPTPTPTTPMQADLGPVSHRSGLRVGVEIGRRGGMLRTLRLYNQDLGDPWLEVEHTGADAG